MSTLYLDRKALTLKLDGATLALYENAEKRGTIPLKMLERVVIRGNMSLESRLLWAFSEHKVDVLFLSGRYSRLSSMGFSHSHNDARRRLAQYQLCHQAELRFELCQRLVFGKCQKQRQLLLKALDIRADLRKSLFQAERTIADIEQSIVCLVADNDAVSRLRGLEGAAASAYFSGFKTLFSASLDFSRRKRRPPPDPVNACLSLGYTLLHFEAVAVCHIVGLDPVLGFYHEPAYGRESLACDMIEPLRPRLDNLVWYLFRKKQLRESHFTQEDGRCLLNKTGRKIFYAEYEGFVHPLRRLLRLQAHQLVRKYLQSATDVL